MKMLKYSLFLGVASTLLCNSSLFAAGDLFGPASMQIPVDQENLESMDPNAGLEQSLAVDLKKDAALQQDLDVKSSVADQEVAVMPPVIVDNANQAAVVNEQQPIMVEPTVIDDTTPPPTLDAKLRVEDAIQKKLEEKKAEEAVLEQQDALLVSQPVQMDDVLSPSVNLVEEQTVALNPAKKVKKARLTQEEIEALRAVRAEKKQAAMQQEEVMPFSEEELAGAPVIENEVVNDIVTVPSAEEVDQEVVVLQEEVLAANAIVQEEQPVASSVKKKKVSKKTKLTPEQIAAIKAGGAEKEAVIAELKAEGAIRKAKEKAAAEEARKAAEEQAILSEHQEKLAAVVAEEMASQDDKSKAAIISGENKKPFAILYFSPDGAVNLSETIEKGSAFNKKGLSPEVVVLDPLNSRREASNDTGAIIVEHTVDGPEVDLAKEQQQSKVTDSAAEIHHDAEVVVAEQHDEEHKKPEEENANPLAALLQ